MRRIAALSLEMRSLSLMVKEYRENHASDTNLAHLLT